MEICLPHWIKPVFSDIIYLPLDTVGKLWYNMITYQNGGYKLNSNRKGAFLCQESTPPLIS